MRKLSIVISLAAVCSFSQFAEADSFRCDIKQVKELGEQGCLTVHSLSDVIRAEQILVDRESGKVFHPYFGNESYTVREVLDAGSSVSSFKVIATSPLSPSKVSGEAPFRNVTFLQVMTYSEEREIPFIVMNGHSIGTGVCK